MSHPLIGKFLIQCKNPKGICEHSDCAYLKGEGGYSSIVFCIFASAVKRDIEFSQIESEELYASNRN